MAVTVTITRSVRDTNLSDWGRVCGTDRDFLMHPGLLEAAEAAMGPGTAGAAATGCATQFWYLLAYEDGEPVGAACVTEYPLDAMVFASPLAERVVAAVRRVFPRYLKFRVTFCGLPISIAGSNVRVAAHANQRAVVAALNEAVEQIACQRRTWLVVYKELDTQEAAMVDALAPAGYVRTESLPMNRIARRFESLGIMVAAMRSHYRYKIAKSRAKFAASRLTLARTTDRKAIERLYTPAVHALYEQVTRRAEHRLEILPREFFLELATRFPNELVLTTICEGPRVVVFAWSLRHGAIYHNLFVGIDYERNDQVDAYFNLMLSDIAHGLETPVEEIYVGQTADDFKSRLGCTTDPRYLFIKVTNPLLRWCFRLWEQSILTGPPLPPRRNVFKDEHPDPTPPEIKPDKLLT
jgi:predicted N-acyltransferase